MSARPQVGLDQLTKPDHKQLGLRPQVDNKTTNKMDHIASNSSSNTQSVDFGSGGLAQGAGVRSQ